jgi:glycosyltransferase involved in cell wall biosynthesis
MVGPTRGQNLLHRPAIAIISNSHTPYRLHLHQRIAREIPEVRLWSLYTHQTSNAPWSFSDAATVEIGAVLFGKGESSEHQAAPWLALREWRRAGRIIAWMIEQDVRFVLMMGYNDAGRVRIIRWCRRVGIPCWLFGDSNILGDRTGWVKRCVKRPAVRRIVRWCDGVFCCGKLGFQYFVDYGADPSRCLYFPYEPDYGLIKHLSSSSIDQARRRFGLSEHRRRIVFSGRLTSVKRPDLVIAAFAAVAARRPNWDLLMIGDGPLRTSLDASLPPDLRQRIIWTGFLDDQATVSALYRSSDVLILPSDFEPWGLVVNEAAAAGLAIICSEVVGASAELVRDQFNGRIVSPGDLEKLTSCVLDVTDCARINTMKSASSVLLADWRNRGDPVRGLCQALVTYGLIEKASYSDLPSA